MPRASAVAVLMTELVAPKSGVSVGVCVGNGVTEGNDVFVAVGTDVFVCVGTGVCVVVGIGVYVFVGLGVGVQVPGLAPH